MYKATRSPGIEKGEEKEAKGKEYIDKNFGHLTFDTNYGLWPISKNYRHTLL